MAAVANPGAQCTIISRFMLHKNNKHMKSQGKSLPKLKLRSPPLYGTSRSALDITAMVNLKFLVDDFEVTTHICSA